MFFFLHLDITEDFCLPTQGKIATQHFFFFGQYLFSLLSIAVLFGWYFFFSFLGKNVLYWCETGDVVTEYLCYLSHVWSALYVVAATWWSLCNAALNAAFRKHRDHMLLQKKEEKKCTLRNIPNKRKKKKSKDEDPAPVRRDKPYMGTFTTQFHTPHPSPYIPVHLKPHIRTPGRVTVHPTPLHLSPHTSRPARIISNTPHGTASPFQSNTHSLQNTQ